MTTTQKAPAYVEWSLMVECPHCEGDSIDLADLDADYDHAFSKRIFNNAWDDLKGYEVECPHCHEEFQIEKVEY